MTPRWADKLLVIGSWFVVKNNIADMEMKPMKKLNMVMKRGERAWRSSFLERTT